MQGWGGCHENGGGSLSACFLSGITGPFPRFADLQAPQHTPRLMSRLSQEGRGEAPPALDGDPSCPDGAAGGAPAATPARTSDLRLLEAPPLFQAAAVTVGPWKLHVSVQWFLRLTTTTF